jgi:ABC-type nitrate/sulfonate/bicarbonate transport system substrate-binding protein
MMIKTFKFWMVYFAAAVMVLDATWSLGAEKIRVAYVSPSVSQSLPWFARELGILAKYDLAAEVLLITGSPRLVQSLIAGDVDFVFAGVAALIRARARGAEVAILGASANASSQKIMISKTSKIRRIEDLKGAIIGVSQYGSEADTFARVALAQAGLKPDKDTTIIQLGGHPQVAASLAAGKLEIGVLGGLATLTAERAGARLLTSAQELKVLSPSGTFATTRGYIQKNRSVVDRLMRSFVEALHYIKTNRNGTITLLQKYLGGLNTEEAAYLYEDQVNTLEALPAPNEKAIQAVLDRESDPKIKSTSVADVIDPTFFKDIEKSGLIEQLYKGKDKR